MRKSIYKFFIVVTFLLPMTAFPNQVKLLPALPYMQKIGLVKFRYWFWSVYNIGLYAQKTPWSYQQAFALKIEYLRHFTRQELAEETIRQIQRQPFYYSPKNLQQWKKQLSVIFVDVHPGNVLIGYFDGKQNSRFYTGKGKFLGQIKGRDFAVAFFNIWLSKNSLDPKLTRKLLGE